MNQVFTTSVRDKIALVALVLFGVLSFLTMWINKDLSQAMVGLIGTIVSVLAAFYKGNPASAGSLPGSSPPPGPLDSKTPPLPAIELPKDQANG